MMPLSRKNVLLFLLIAIGPASVGRAEEISDEAVVLIATCLVIIMKIVCFILGYCIVRLGYRLIGLGATGKFKFEAEIYGIKADLVSVSPGLLFVVLGVFLIGYAISVEKRIELKGGPVIIGSPAARSEKTEINIPVRGSDDKPVVQDVDDSPSQNTRRPRRDISIPTREDDFGIQ